MKKFVAPFVKVVVLEEHLVCSASTDCDEKGEDPTVRLHNTQDGGTIFTNPW